MFTTVNTVVVGGGGSFSGSCLLVYEFLKFMPEIFVNLRKRSLSAAPPPTIKEKRAMATLFTLRRVPFNGATTAIRL